jgi:hypothetical protein
MSTEQQTTVDKQQEVVVNEPENIVSAPVITGENNEIVIEEGAKVLPMSEFAKGAEPGVTYLKEADYQKWKEGSLKTKKDEAPAEQQQPQTTLFDETTWLKEKTGGKFEKWDDLWSKAQSEPELKFENEQSKTVYDYIQQGKLDEVAQFIVLQKTLSGAETASDEDVVKMRMQIEEPDLDVDLAFDVEFEKPDESEMDEDAYKKAMYAYSRRLKKAAQDARSFLSDRKSELVLPPLSQQQQVNPVEKLDADIKEGMAKIHESVIGALPKITDLPIQFNNGGDVVVDYKYSFSDQEKGLIADALKDYGSFFEDRYATKEGGYDGQKLANDVLLLNNFPKIMQAAITDAIMKERLNFINQSANYRDREINPAKIDVVKEQEKKTVQRIFES